MPAKTQITGEFAKPSDVASHLRIPAARVAELRRQVFALFERADGSVLVEIKGPPKSSSRKVAKTPPGSSTRSKKK
jgi:hypothetical protein